MSELLYPICDKNVQSVNVTPDCQHTTKEIFDYARTLRKQLDEEHDYYKRVVDEECAPDELHCTCVPALRNEIDALRKELELSRKIADEAIKQTEILTKQLDEWKEAHDNLARQLSVTNDSLEIAVEALRQIPHTCYHHPALACAGCIAQEALKRLEARYVPTRR
jgi:succinate dehydrogenase/fumarate reductase flavoprotein subunit